MRIIFDDPAANEDEYRESAPPAVYKYRNCQSDIQKSMLVKQEIWFAHPVTLNDPKDLRPEYAYSQAEIESQAYFQMLLDSAPGRFPNISDPAVLRQIAVEQWERTKADPKDIFDSARAEFETDESFDPYGVFSTSTNSLSKRTWELYADDFKGYCMGFDTTSLWKQLNCTTDHMTYSDDPFPFSFLKDPGETGADLLFYKGTQWAYEDEFRFVTTLKPEPRRLRTFNQDIVTKVIIGHNMPQADQDELIAALRAQYRADLPVYKTAIDSAGAVTKFRITIRPIRHV